MSLTLWHRIPICLYYELAILRFINYTRCRYTFAALHVAGYEHLRQVTISFSRCVEKGSAFDPLGKFVHFLHNLTNATAQLEFLTVFPRILETNVCLNSWVLKGFSKRPNYPIHPPSPVASPSYLPHTK